MVTIKTFEYALVSIEESMFKVWDVRWSNQDGTYYRHGHFDRMALPELPDWEPNIEGEVITSSHCTKRFKIKTTDFVMDGQFCLDNIFEVMSAICEYYGCEPSRYILRLDDYPTGDLV